MVRRDAWLSQGLNPTAAPGLNVSALNDVRRIRASGAAGADIFARFDRLAVLFLEIAKRNAGDVTHLAMVIGVLDHGPPRHGKTNIRRAAVRCRKASCLLRGLN